MNNLVEEVKLTRIMSSQAGGHTDSINSSVVDMAGFDGIVFIAQFGGIDPTGAATMTAKQSATNAVGAALKDAAAAADASDDELCLVIDIFRPEKRYMSVSIARATANVEIDSVLAIQYRARNKPTSHASLAAAVVELVTPAEA